MRRISLWMQSYLQYLTESIGNEFASGFKEEVYFD